jgi:cobalt-precorrin 5A hydrolase
MSTARAEAVLPRRLAYVALTRGGARLAVRLATALPGTLYASERWRAEAGAAARALGERPGDSIPALLAAHDGLVFFTAVGVAVRLIAPCVRDKREDPAVVAVDDAGRYAVSVLSGHLGGGNALAERVAAILGAAPVVTTASEARGTLPVDLLGRDHGWRLENSVAVKRASAALVNDEPVGLVQEAGETDWWDGPLPSAIRRYGSLEALAEEGCPGLVITDRVLPAALAAASARWVVYRPRTLVLGVGASSGVDSEEIEALARATLRAAGLAWDSVHEVATLDRKLEEPGLVAFAHRHGLPLRGFAAGALAAVPVPNASPLVARHVGTPSVCEAAACLAAGGPLVVAKRKSARATAAVARRGEAG